MNKKLKKFAALVLGGAMMFSMMGIGTSLAARWDFNDLPVQKQGSFREVPTYAIQRFFYFHASVYRNRIGIPDGSFGPKTKSTVIFYQDNAALRSRDGIVGKETYQSINERIDKYYDNYTGGYERWEKLDYANTSSKVGVIQRGTTTGKWGTWNKNGSYIVM